MREAGSHALGTAGRAAAFRPGGACASGVEPERRAAWPPPHPHRLLPHTPARPSTAPHPRLTPVQVEVSANRGVLRTLGIALGGLLGLAAGCNASLLANPFYFTGVILLGTAAFR